MAVRGSASRRVPGNPMAGVLRDLNRSARRVSRRSGGGAGGSAVEEVDPPIVLPPPEKRRPAALWPGPAAAVVTTGPEGRAVWRFPAPFSAPPVIGAVPVWAGPYGGGEAVAAAIEKVSEEAVTVQVWLVTAAEVLAGPAGMPVHLTAVPAGRGAQG
ncbi:hypothetical protein OV450_1345 [Actinobacteria bacterium OV450]|nr:hypothetical protein OV450_1345 [Actinobacteria bacterium OV450]